MLWHGGVGRIDGFEADYDRIAVRVWPITKLICGKLAQIQGLVRLLTIFLVSPYTKAGLHRLHVALTNITDLHDGSVISAGTRGTTQHFSSSVVNSDEPVYESVELELDEVKRRVEGGWTKDKGRFRERDDVADDLGLLDRGPVLDGTKVARGTCRVAE